MISTSWINRDPTSCRRTARGRPRGEASVLFGGLTLDRQLAKRPQHVQYCKWCAVSNQRPRIIFDAEGVCSACRYAYEKHHGIDWAERERMLIDLLDRHRSRDG